MKTLGVVYISILSLFMPYLNVANTEYLSNVGIVTYFINDKKGVTNRSRLLIYRWVVLLMTCSIAFVTDKVEIVENISGSLCIPAISYGLPVNEY